MCISLHMSLDVVWSFDYASLKMEEKYKMDFGLSKNTKWQEAIFKEFAENEVKTT